MVTSGIMRGLGWVGCAVLGVAVLSGCDDINAYGSGTVTITSDTAATTFDPSTNLGTVAYVCAAGASTCHDTDPYLYAYYPRGGEQSWIVTPGLPVFDRSGQVTPLPSGTYVVQGTDYINNASLFTNLVTIDVFPTSGTDRTIMHQAYQRDGADASCSNGWQPSWAQWPNDGTGGFVCNRQIYAYHPDLPVD